MAFYDTTWYVNGGDGSTTGHWAVPKRAVSTAYTVGQMVRQFTAPAINSERVFICTIAGTTSASADATWVLTRGSKTVDGTVTWQECTGQASLNSDITNTQTWAYLKTFVANPSLGVIIKRSTNTSYHMCTTSGTMGTAEPPFTDTAGSTATEVTGTAVWTCLGPVSNFTTKGAAPFARLYTAGGTNWLFAGMTVYVASTHTELSTASMTINFDVVSTTLIKVICHNVSGAYPPTTSADLATTAQVTGNSTITITVASGYIYGIQFKSGIGSSTGSSAFISVLPSGGGPFMHLDTCLLQIYSTSTGNYMRLGSGGATPGNIILNNTPVYVAASTSSNGFIMPGSTRVHWRNTSPLFSAGSTIPNNLFHNMSQAGGLLDIVIEGCDLSQLTTSIYDLGSYFVGGSFIVRDCKLSSTINQTNPINSGFYIVYARCST